MQTIGKTIKEELESPQESNHTDSSQQKVNSEFVDRFWKNEFVNSMKFSEPNFIIDERNKHLISELYKWVWKINGCFDCKKGLLFWGGLGVGKSALLKGIRHYECRINMLLNNGMKSNLGFALVSAAELSLKYANDGADAIKHYADMQNLAIDEVGREPIDSKHYGTNINPVQLVLQLRYEHRNQGYTHITTNLNPDNEFGIYGDYVVDRMKEMFNVIEVTGSSRR